MIFPEFIPCHIACIPARFGLQLDQSSRAKNKKSLAFVCAGMAEHARLLCGVKKCGTHSD